MTNKKSIIGISIIFTIVTICVAAMLFTTSLADTQTTPEAEASTPESIQLPGEVNNKSDIVKESITGEFKNDVTYSLTYKLTKEGLPPIPLQNVLVKFFNNDGVYVGEGITNTEGEGYFNNLSEANAAGTLLIADPNYSNQRKGVALSDYNAEHQATVKLGYVEYPPNFFVNSDNDNHNSFSFTEYSVDGETVLSCHRFSISSFAENLIPANCNGTYEVDNNGTLKITPENLSFGEAIVWNIDALAKSGFEIDYWTVQYNNEEPKKLKFGEKIEISDWSGFEFDVSIQAFYKAVVTPPPVPEVVTETAQTGDSCEAVLPLAILAIVSAAALIARRKTNQK